MKTNSNHPLLAVPVSRHEGNVWHRLHSEREEICETLLKDYRPDLQTLFDVSEPDEVAQTWHRELLQSRLRKIDDALDRLMSGSYGNCCKCGRWIEDPKLEFDPAVAFCFECWQRQNRPDHTHVLGAPESEALPQDSPVGDSDHLTETDNSREGVALETLAPFDLLCVRTLNSEYRIFLLDPRTGRALIEGGRDLVEPVEGMVTGSKSNSKFRVGWIGKGLRAEFWAEGKIIRTSPVQSFHVEHQVSNQVVSSQLH